MHRFFPCPAQGGGCLPREFGLSCPSTVNKLQMRLPGTLAAPYPLGFSIAWSFPSCRPAADQDNSEAAPFPLPWGRGMGLAKKTKQNKKQLSPTTHEGLGTGLLWVPTALAASTTVLQPGAVGWLTDLLHWTVGSFRKRTWLHFVCTLTLTCIQ